MTDACENITFPHTTYAVGHKQLYIRIFEGKISICHVKNEAIVLFISVLYCRDFTYRVYYFVRINELLLDARVDRCLNRAAFTDALSNVDVSVSASDEKYDAFVYTNDDTTDLIEYE